jgi:hypothetical protein
MQRGFFKEMTGCVIGIANRSNPKLLYLDTPAYRRGGDLGTVHGMNWSHLHFLLSQPCLVQAACCLDQSFIIAGEGGMPIHGPFRQTNPQQPLASRVAVVVPVVVATVVATVVALATGAVPVPVPVGEALFPLVVSVGVATSVELGDGNGLLVVTPASGELGEGWVEQATATNIPSQASPNQETKKNDSLRV